LVDIILDAEEAFDIEIDDESAEKMLTVQAAVDIVAQKLAE
jgi:acyl carrier protein